MSTGEHEPQYRVLEGRFVRELRSHKGKLKGIYLQTREQEYPIRLPKYLRPILARELALGSPVRVWLSPKKDGWEAFNVIPLSPQALDAQDALPPAPVAANPQPARPRPCVQVCRKGSCCKRGSGEVYEVIEDAIATNPNLRDLKLESTGCLKECKKGPAIKLSPTKEVFTRVTPENVVAILEEHCAQPAPETVSASVANVGTNGRSPVLRH